MSETRCHSGSGRRHRGPRGCASPAARFRSILLFLALLVPGGCGREGDRPGPPGPQAASPPDDDAIVQAVPEGRIDAVERPVFAGTPEAAEFMRPEEPVLGLVTGGKARAYSLWYLDRHEVVNDRVGEEPIVVAWCPLAYAGRAFRRQAEGRPLTFVVSGRLWRNALVMRDRETSTLWSQVSGEALDGPLKGSVLEPLAAVIAPWSEWCRLHPEGLVLRRPPLEGTLYAAYFADPERVGFYGQRRRDLRLAAKAQVIGLAAGDLAVAVPLEALRRHPIWNERVGERAVLMASLGPEGPEVAYAGEVSGRALRFEAADSASRARDVETGTLWDLSDGRALDGPLRGRGLEPLPALRAYWFVWSAFHPGTELRQSPSG